MNFLYTQSFMLLQENFAEGTILQQKFVLRIARKKFGKTLT